MAAHDELDGLPSGEGCENCNGTGYVEDESCASDRDGCPECQE